MFGAVAKLVGGTIDGERQLSALDQAIATVQRECDRPLLDGLAGAERYRSAAALLDATLLARMNEASSADKRAELVERYLVHLHEEFTMANADLKTATASRAEVVALGLALREVALSLDTELAAFRGSAGQTASELRDAAQEARADALRQVEHSAAKLERRVDQGIARLDAHVQGEIASAAASLASALDERMEQTSEALAGDMRRATAETHDRLRAHIQEQAREMKAALDARAEQSHVQLGERVDAQVLQARQAMDARAQAMAAAQQREIERLSQENRAVLQASVDEVRMEHAQRVESVQAALEASSQAQHEALCAAADELRSTIHGLSTQLRETIAAHHAQHQQAVDDIRNAQAALRTGVVQMEHRLRTWIYAVLALAFIALLVAL